VQGRARIFMFERGGLGELVGETRAHHLEGLQVARRSPTSRDVKAALTRVPREGEAGADFCLLGPDSS